MKTLSVVIPVYNERKTILEVLRRVESASAGGMSKEIVLIDDCSTDGTRDILKDLANTGKYTILFQEKNGGKGKALRTGFAQATGDFILIQDADLEANPAEYPNLLAPLLAGTADVVYGSRFKGHKITEVFSNKHYLVNWSLTTFSNIFTHLPLTDMETCYKVFTKNALTKILPDLRSNRFGIEPEITAIVAKNDFRLSEVAISYIPRKEDKKMKWYKDGPLAGFTVLVSWFRFSAEPYLLLTLLGLAIFSIAVLHPTIKGDGTVYVRAMEFIKDGAASGQAALPPDVISRIMTGSGAMGLLILIDAFFNNLTVSWLIMNGIFYIAMGAVFYSILRRLRRSPEVSFIATLFLVTNYAVVTAGLGYLMDVGGWMFYVISLYFSLLYLQTKQEKWLYVSATVIGLGGLFKEYALLGYIVLFGCILFVNRDRWGGNIKKSFVSGLIAFSPFIAMNIYSLFAFDYTYINWLSAQGKYVYQSRLAEYIKSFGSLYNFGWFLFLPGFYLLLKDSKKMWDDTSTAFLWLVLLSGLPIFLWAAITQRIEFIAVPGLILVSSLYMERMQKHRYVLFALLGAYVLSSYCMDSVILNAVNLPF